MKNPPGAIRFTLRGLFVSVAFVGIGLLALKHANPWVFLVVQMAIYSLFAYAVIAVTVNTGNRRLFWMTFLAFAVMWFIADGRFLPLTCTEWLWQLQYPDRPFSDNRNPFGPFNGAYHEIAARLYFVAFSTVAAYLIPWIAQRGQKA